MKLLLVIISLESWLDGYIATYITIINATWIK